MPHLALLRHGQSQWNLENRFTGWVDVDLTVEGEAQARHAGVLLKGPGRRSTGSNLGADSGDPHRSLALEAMGQAWLPVVRDWRLNERHYGGLTGLDKAETARKHGEAQVLVWRRSYDVPPPPLAPGGEWDFAQDRRYADAVIPATESLKDTLARVQPYWETVIERDLSAGRNVIVAAHGNSLRAIVKLLFAVPDDAIVAVEIPTGNPLLLHLDAGLKVSSARYLDRRARDGVADGAVSRSVEATDEHFMRRALDLAAGHAGKTGKNPSVGCVLVKNGAIVGEGATGEGGRPHAEEVALLIAGEDARGCTAYVTLEPCAQRSSGGVSCSELFGGARVARVVVAVFDPHPFAAGVGIARLRGVGVAVELGLLEAEATAHHAAFFAPHPGDLTSGMSATAYNPPKHGESVGGCPPLRTTPAPRVAATWRRPSRCFPMRVRLFDAVSVVHGRYREAGKRSSNPAGSTASVWCAVASGGAQPCMQIDRAPT